MANKRNGIDVDKFDYLLRDSKMCGVTVELDPERLMMLSRLDRAKEKVGEWHSCDSAAAVQQGAVHHSCVVQL